MKHTKLIAITLMAVGLAAGLITSTKSQADQPTRRHEAIVIGYHATYRDVLDEAGNVIYRTEDDFVIDLVSGSEGAPDVKLGKRLGDTIAYLSNEGFKFKRSLAFSLDVFEK